MICFSGGRELDWCRNYLSPFSQHSSPPKQRHQELEVTASQLCLCDSQRGSSCGRSRGAAPPLDSPMHVALSLPSSQESVVSLLPIYYDCMCADTATPPWGEGRVQGPACSTFSILELYQIKSLLFVQFFTASIPDCFLSYILSVLAKAEVIRVSP